VMNEGPESTPSHLDIHAFFPKTGGSSRVEAGKEISFKSLQFDAEEGPEKLWLVWADQPIQELEPLEKYANSSAKGVVKDPTLARAAAAFLERHNALPVDVAPSDADKQITLTTRGPMLAYLLKLKHH